MRVRDLGQETKLERAGLWLLLPATILLLIPLHTTNFLDQIAMASPDEGWIVGDRGTLFHYIQGAWHTIHWSDELSLFSVSLLPGDGTEGWIFGVDNNPQPRIWHKQGTDWHEYQSDL